MSRRPTLKESEILEIVKLKKEFTTAKVAHLLKVSPSTVRYWMRRLRKEGYNIPLLRRKPLKIKRKQ